MKRERTETILVVDDTMEMARMLADALADHGYDAVPVASGRAAIDLLVKRHFDAVITDLRMPEVDGMEVLAHSKKLSPERPVIVMTAYSAIDTAVESIRQGAHHYLTKPFKTEELVIFLERALDELELRREARALRDALREKNKTARLTGRSAAIRGVVDVIDRLASSPLPVLIEGETGTGKGLAARAIHAEGPRASGPFVTVNCAALPHTLLESELFGHVKGAFTGATASRPGLFTEATGGTLFLDEIGELAMPLQAKLLDVLERGKVRPVGSEREHAVDARIIAATNQNLRSLSRAGSFRQDLLYRLDVVTIEMPALRHRREDIPDLIQQFLEEAKARHPASIVARLSPDALERLLGYDWPGNARELSHVIERVVALGRGPEATLGDLPGTIRENAGGGGSIFRGDVMPIRELQRKYAAWALEQLGGHRGRTAQKLEVDGKTLAKWLGPDADLPPG